MKIVDFRSDTLTKPTDEMRKAMYKAEVGDDVYGEDPTINRLESLAASKVGKEAALFVPTGTMGNQLALLAHTNRGQEVILEDWAHIFRYEVGGLAFLSGLQARTIKGNKGIMDPLEIERSIVRDDDIHNAETGLICLENTHNMAGGVVTPLNVMEKTYDIAKKNNLPVHLDGARIFNAATYLNTNVKEITQYTDSLMFCLSKGLCAPVGSILAGNEDFIIKARKLRKMLGGGMRQAGVLASAGIVALEKMIDRLEIDHENIRLLGEGLSNIKGIKVDSETIHTNILMVNVKDTGLNSKEFVFRMKENGILISAITDEIVRFVSHYYIKREDVKDTINIINNTLNN